MSRAKRLQLGRYDLAAFLSFIAYAAASIAIPLALIEIGRTLNFPLDGGGQSAGGALQIGRGIPMVLAMLGCLFFSGMFLKKHLMGFALLLMGSGIAAAALAPGYIWLFAALTVAGLGEGVVEAMATPVIQELHEDDEPGRYINFGHGFWSVGIVLAVLAIGGALQSGINWRYLVLASAVLALLPALIFLLPSRRKCFSRNRDLSCREVTGELKKIFHSPRFWLFAAAMFFAGGGEFALTFWGASYIRLEHGGGALAGSMATAVFSVGMIAGRLGTGILVKEKNLGRLVVAFAFTGAVTGLLLPQLKSLPLIFIFFFLSGIVSAPFWPSIQNYAVNRLKLDSTAIYILLSCTGIPGCAFFTWLMGCIGDRCSLTASLYVVAVCYASLGILITAEMLKPPAGREDKK